MNIKHLQLFSLLLVLGLTASCSQKLVSHSENASRSISSGPGEMGKRIGNGGGACVCRNPNDKSKITYAELIDFVYIRESTDGEKNVKRSNKINYKDLLLEIYSDVKLLQEGRNLLKTEIDSLAPEFYSGASISLRETPDSILKVNCAIALKNKNCEYEQAANYTDSGQLKIKKEIFNAFTETDKAGLMLHEALYSIDRKENNAKWADETRTRVGSYFAGDVKPINKFFLFAQAPDTPFFQPGSFVALNVLDHKSSVYFLPAIIISNTNNKCSIKFANIKHEEDSNFNGKMDIINEFKTSFDIDTNTVAIPCTDKRILIQSPGLTPKSELNIGDLRIHKSNDTVFQVKAMFLYHNSYYYIYEILNTKYPDYYIHKYIFSFMKYDKY